MPVPRGGVLHGACAAVIDTLLEHLREVALVFVTMPLTVSEKFYFVYVLTFVGLAWISYRRYHSKSGKTRKMSALASVKRFFRFLFPARIYLHRSARVDYGLFLINLLISPLLLVAAGLQAHLSAQIAGALVELNSGQAIVTGNWSTGVFAVFIVGYTLVADLSVYVVHRIHHKSDILWPIHALHHSAQVMTPVTLFRKHPLWNLIAHTMNMVFTGVFQGLFVFVFFGVPSVELLFGLNTLYVVYNFFGANLRHSHVWLSWGKPASYLFISPAMHQIHHDPQRMQKNYGEIFAIWDWLFGSLYIPQQRETFAIGLGEDNPHATLARAYWVPLAQMFRQLARKLGRKQP